MYEYTKHTLKSFISFIYSSFKSYQEEKIINRQKTDYGKPIIEYVKDFYDVVSFDVDIHHDELKKWVTEKILVQSGLIVKGANLDKRYVINYPSRRYYGVNSPYSDDKNLFYFPDESNRTIIQILNPSNFPENIYIYWKDNECEGALAKELVTTIYGDTEL